MLEGKNVNLRVMEKEDVAFSTKWINEGIYGEYGPILQLSRAQEEKYFENPPPIEVALQPTGFMIEKKDGTKIGMAGYLTVQPYRVVEIGYWLLPNERGKGYGTEVVQTMVDYLSLSKDVGRVQATTHIENLVSRKVLEKVGFRREGIMKDSFHKRKLGARARETLFVGDHIDNDYRGARAVGIHALLIEREDRSTGNALDLERVRSLEEIFKFIN